MRLELWRNVTQRNGEHRGLFITKLLLTQRHRWCVEKQRIFASFINTLVYFITKQWFARFIKTFITKAISNMYTTSLSLFVPSAPPWYCLLCFHLRVLPLSVWLLYVVGLLYHSKFLKNHLRCIVGKCQEHTSSVAFINSCFYFFLDLLWYFNLFCYFCVRIRD